MVFSVSSAASREFARQAARKSPVGRDPAAAGRRSWEKRSAALKAQHLAALEAAADRAKGNAAMAELCRNPQFLLERMISGLRAEAIARGEVPPMYYMITPLDRPTTIKNPGRTARRKREAKSQP
jgi:hypothetical protein